MEELEGKLCPRCGEYKLRGFFGLSKKTKSGLNSWCKKCCIEANKTPCAKERRKERDRIKFVENRDLVIERQKKWKETIGGKVCSVCGVFKLFSEFSRRKNSNTGIVSSCRECIKKIRHKPEVLLKAKISHRAYFLTHKEQRNNKNRIWRKSTYLGKYLGYRANAKRKGHYWDLSREEFSSFWGVPCNYCGGRIETIGLDRVNNSKGYILDNLVPCCKECNLMKRAMDVSVFLSYIQKIYERHCKPCEKSTETSSTSQKQESSMLSARDVDNRL